MTKIVNAFIARDILLRALNDEARTKFEADPANAGQTYEPITDVQICLEPEAVQAQKEVAGKTDQLWVFRFVGANFLPEIGRGDGAFFVVEMNNRGGWYQPAFNQEPAMTEAGDIGHAIVVRRADGKIRVIDGTGLDGKFGQVVIGSRSNPKQPQLLVGDVPMGHIFADPQRIRFPEGQRIAVYRRVAEFPDVEARTDVEFASEGDSRSLAAAYKALFATPVGDPVEAPQEG